MGIVSGYEFVPALPEQAPDARLLAHIRAGRYALPPAPSPVAVHRALAKVFRPFDEQLTRMET